MRVCFCGESGLERIPGTGIFLTTSRIGVPASVTTLYRHMHVLHENVVLLSIQVGEIPFVDPDKRIRIYKMPDEFWYVTGYYGYLDEIDAQNIIQSAVDQGLPVDTTDATYFVRQLIIDTSGSSRLANWRRKLFLIMHRNAWPSVWAYGLPPNRTVGVGVVIRV